MRFCVRNGEIKWIVREIGFSTLCNPNFRQYLAGNIPVKLFQKLSASFVTIAAVQSFTPEPKLTCLHR